MLTVDVGASGRVPHNEVDELGPRPFSFPYELDLILKVSCRWGLKKRACEPLGAFAELRKRIIFCRE